MAGTEIANAYVALTVRMPGVASDIARSLGGSAAKAAADKAGEAMGNTLGGAIRKSLGRSKFVLSDVVAGFKDAQAAASSFTGYAGTVGGALRKAMDPGINAAKRVAEGFRDSQVAASTFSGFAGSLGGTLRKAFDNGPLSKFRDGFNNVNAAASSFSGIAGSMGGVAASAWSRIQSVASSVASGVSRAWSSIGPAVSNTFGNIRTWAGQVTKDLGDKFALAAKGASLALGGILTGAGVAGWNRLTGIEDATASLTVTMGDAAKASKLLDDVMGVVTGTPYNFDQFATAASTLGGFGISADKIPGYLTAIGEAAATKGSKANEFAQRMSTTFGQMAAISQVSMQDMWALSDVGVNGLAILGNSFGVTTDEMKKMISNGMVPAEQAMDILTEGIINGSEGIAGTTTALEGTMEGLRETTSGVVGGMASAFSRFGAAALEPLMPLIKDVGQTLTDFLNDATKTVGPVLESFVKWMTENKDIVATLAVALGSVVGVLGAVIAAVKTWSAVQAVLNMALMANPIGAIILAISALVGAIVYFFTQTELGKEIWANFTQFLGEAWANISGFFTAAWENVIQPVFQAIGEIATWVYETVLKPVFDGIAAVVGFLGAAFKLHFDLIVNAFRLVGAIANWLWINVLSPVFTAIGQIVSWVWTTFISPIFAAIGVGLSVLGDAFNWLWLNVIQPVWDGISTAMSAAWSWIDTNVFTPFKKGIDLVAKGFEIAKSAIEKTWEGIKKAAAVPINFVLGTVWNDGIRSFWNDMVGTLGLDDMKLPKAPLVKFASGGVMPGYTPGRDVHEFFSPTAGRLALSGGEAIMRPEFTRLVGGKAGVDALNAAARKGQLPFGDGEGNFFGDLWDNITKAASVAWEFLTNPAQAIQSHVIDAIIGPAMGGQNIFGKTAGGLAAKTLMGFVDMFKNAAPSGVGAKGMGWEAMWQVVRNAIPGTVLTSAYRPGAKTVNGGQSYHSMGRAIDLIPASMATFNAVARLFPNASELIYSPAGGRQLLNGQPFNGWSDAVRKQHYNHVHLAMAQGGVVPKLYDQGGWLPHGGLAINKTGKPEAVLTPAESRALRDGLSGPRELVIVDADRQLIGRMQVEAGGVVSARGAAVASGVRNRKWSDA